MKENGVLLLKRIMPAVLALAVGLLLFFGTVKKDSDTPAPQSSPGDSVADTTEPIEESISIEAAAPETSCVLTEEAAVMEESPAEESGEGEEFFFLEPPPVTDYETGVYAGSVRYVCQLKNPKGNGWGKYGYIATSECTTACISMCLSYLGIDASPEKLLDFNRTTYFNSVYGFKEELEYSELTASSVLPADGRPVLEEMFRRYAGSEDGGVSPAMLYLKGNGHNHAMVVLGRESEDVFLVLDPAEKCIHRVSISDKGLITTEEPEYLTRYTDSGKKPAQICGLAQWQLKK